MAVAVASEKPIVARKPSFPFTEVPRHWLGGTALASHLANGLNLLFPLGERFFVRSVRKHMDVVKADPALEARVRGFIAQEVRHGMEHERFFEIMEAQGLEIRKFLAWYEHAAFDVLVDVGTRLHPDLDLAVTVALEHFTAMFAERALEKDVLSQIAHPVMRDLLLWHACEEIEHKSVAFDVLARVNPSYPLRMGGLAMATFGLVFFWMAGAGALLRQEEGLSVRGLLRELVATRERNALMNGELARSFKDYLRRDFHPSQHPNEPLAEAWLRENGARLGLANTQAA
ncbi:MAG: metal-dependent hydrolase [Myxococcales bacterium]|nr:metal-dependent hydrolase [Myxococcales bacterium]